VINLLGTLSPYPVRRPAESQLPLETQADAQVGSQPSLVPPPQAARGWLAGTSVMICMSRANGSSAAVPLAGAVMVVASVVRDAVKAKVLSRSVDGFSRTWSVEALRSKAFDVGNAMARGSKCRRAIVRYRHCGVTNGRFRCIVRWSGWRGSVDGHQVQASVRSPLRFTADVGHLGHVGGGLSQSGVG
jgi:hypothetical protein